jgi:quercetin dioxygenase-like cupin family protein
MSESHGHVHTETHEISGAALPFDLAAAVEEILAAARTSPAKHAARTLVKEGPLRLVLLGFQAGAALKEHHADGPVTIQVLAGDVKIDAAGSERQFGTGGLLVLDANVRHSVTAVSDAVILLTVAWPQ